MRVGFVGLGAMGMHMARNLHRAGLLTAVWNRSPDKAKALAAELNVAAPQSLAQLAGQCEAVVSCVSADADVLEVAAALAPALASGALLIDCSTIGAETARQAAQRLAPAGVEFLDCPVSGGVEGARDATLAIMAGGSTQAFERAQPILKALGRTIAHFGPSGSGQAAKATNQIMCAGIIEAVAEAMAFARAQGLPLERLVETLGKGAGSSWYFVHRAPNMVRGAYPAGFRVRLHAKDLGICRDMAARFGVALPVVERMLGEYAELVARGYGDEDISATYRLKAELFERTNIMGAPARDA
ncbi:MAG TPA: NAD(P)-dependent oxidoreductase [Candidatus Dormibacteraeota bacterium]|nr:NAD(P)-dependent oxidoreductase [Candidatus Dormibacteraeota bacterium]